MIELVTTSEKPKKTTHIENIIPKNEANTTEEQVKIHG